MKTTKIFMKACRVVNLCESMEQAKAAGAYIELCYNKLPTDKVFTLHNMLFQKKRRIKNECVSC